MSQTMGRLLGIDYGTKRIGVAISDPLGIVAQGVTTLQHDGSLMEHLANIVHERGVTLIVVGMPYSDDGGKGVKAQEVDRFVYRLRQELRMEVQTWDESLSSVEAQRAVIAGGMKRKQRREKHRIDEMAARLLLQGYLDAQQQRRSREADDDATGGI
jgi:putative Holliday junction resolvase